jgi:DNA-binding GntR family transcriptional regulator
VVDRSALAPIDKPKLRERVLDALRAAIVSGEMRPGVVYSAPVLGGRLGVSATPVREAMLELVREGLVDTVPNKGFRVTSISEAELDDITAVRLLLEPPVVRGITTLIPDEDFADLEEMAQRIVDAAARSDLVDYTEADRVFHLRLLAYAKNARLVAVVSDLRAHTRLYGLRALADSGELVASAAEHLTIVATLRSRDEEAVERLMRDHIAQTRGRWATG